MASCPAQHQSSATCNPVWQWQHLVQCLGAPPSPLAKSFDGTAGARLRLLPRTGFDPEGTAAAAKSRTRGEKKKKSPSRGPKLFENCEKEASAQGHGASLRESRRLRLL